MLAMKMELRDIEYFCVVASRGNVGRAAEELGLSQPALSKSLRRLEKAVDAKLVKRTPKGVDLTAVGAALFARARGLRLSLEDIAREAADLRHGRAGHLRIGTGARYAVDLIPSACATLLREAPQVTMTISVGSVDMLAPALLRGELDLSVTGGYVAGYDALVREHLTEDEVVVYASKNHRLAKRKRVTLSEVAQERWVLARGSAAQERLRRAFAQSGLPPPRVAVEENAVLFRRHLLPMTDLLGFGPKRFFRESSSREHLVELPIKGLSSRQSVGVCYRKDGYFAPATQRFIEILKETAKTLAARTK
jgi:DNA-binding transcriptional LysR family regulator